jgi:hypothetical protein
MKFTPQDVIKSHFSQLGKKSAAARKNKLKTKKSLSDYYRDLGRKGLNKRWKKSVDNSSLR